MGTPKRSVMVEVLESLDRGDNMDSLLPVSYSTGSNEIDSLVGII
jgi:hypothetical protein